MLSIPVHFGPTPTGNSEKASSLPSSLLNGDESFKILVVGGQKSGKSCLVHRFLCNEFDANGRYDKTLGATLSIHFFAQVDHRVSFAIWEIGGDESYRNTLIPYFSDNTAAALLLINVNQPDSKKEAAEIYELLKKCAPTATIWVIGTQAEELNPTKAAEFIKWVQDTFKNGNVKITSAKSGEGVETVFHEIRVALLEPYG